MGRRDVRLLKLLITLTKNDGLKHLGKIEESQQEKEPVDDEYELLKYSSLLREDRSLIDVVEKDTFDNLICTWFADVSNLTPNQRKLNKELLCILKGFLFCSSKSYYDYVIKLKDFLQKNENNKEDLRTIVNLERGESKLTLLHALSSINDLAIEGFIDLLLEGGAELNAKDDRGRTPLHYAACSSFSNINFLLKKGALSISDEQGKTPLDIAIDNHNYHLEDCFLTDEQKNLKEELYSALVSNSQSQLEKLLNEPKNTQNLKKILNLHDYKGRSKILQIARNVLHNKEDLRKEVERLLLGAGAIDYEGF
ncbi:ankyrin repeat domain-containing protein [Wolbachia endosymbiont of Madathamugadia hiepei]|uniref:ankyrin repeat domain-containing protein n=1 Tax=Wolbachia endosymbiont of Madathamugadia hiepei TaxID=1241303 RepID=UPI0031B61E2E